MIPATAIVRFSNMAGNTVIDPAFTEFLWEQDPVTGRVTCHVEIDTVAYTDPATSITYGPGIFTKGSATGAFSIYYGQDLTPPATLPFWVAPTDGAWQQPPLQTGQGRWGYFSRHDGLADNTQTEGYTSLSPRTVGQAVVFNLMSIHRGDVTLGAQHFVSAGDLRFYFEFSYMADPPE
jgi:hypothetical protein